MIYTLTTIYIYLQRDDNIQAIISAGPQTLIPLTQKKGKKFKQHHKLSLTLSEAFNQTDGMQDNTLLNTNANTFRKHLNNKITKQTAAYNKIMSVHGLWEKILRL